MWPFIVDDTVVVAVVCDAVVAVVVADTRYIGCYRLSASPYDFQTLMWWRSVNGSASMCISDCQQQGYMYAAIHGGEQNGTMCYCGNSLPSDGQVSYDRCRGGCRDTLTEDCGGLTTNAVYATGIGREPACNT
jgi:WSC domain